MTEDLNVIWSSASDEQRAQWMSTLSDSVSLRESHPTLEHILCRAIFSHDFDLVRACLSKGVKLDCWVHESVGACLSIDLMEILIPAGLDVNYNLGRQGYYVTMAVQKNDISLTKYLLEHGAGVNKPGVTYRFPALTLAVLNGNAEMVELLIQHGAQINGSGALGMAAAHCKFKMMDLLLKHGVDVNINDNNPKTNRLRLIMGNKDFTALHEAASAGHFDVVVYLIKHGANPNLQEARGRTPSMLARENGHWEVVELLDK